MKNFLLFLFILCSCSQPSEQSTQFETQEFTGREEHIGRNKMARRPVYRAKVHKSWIRIDPEGLILDTTKPNVSFLIEDQLLVTVHTFPTTSLEERIPPIAQVQRWERQLDHTKTDVEPVSHGGFAGLVLDGGSVLAWSMQLDLEHYQTLSFLAASQAQDEHFKQMRADYTIKASGSKELIEKHREELYTFANSFELIQEIPKRM